MIIKDLIDKLNYSVLTESTDLSVEISGIYTSDLLSWVMSHASKQDAWVTIQSHTNIIAVALLTEISCIVIAEDAPVDEETITKANEEGITILTTSDHIAEVIRKMYDLGI